jgi:hypothetical protein
MTDRAILTAEHEVLPILEQMELDRDKLIDIVRIADGERALCTSNDVDGFDLIMMNDKVARGLRDSFCGARWEKDKTDNQAGIRNSNIKLRIIACNFDHNAGSLLVDPTNLYRKGAASSKKARCNATAWLPNLPEIPTQEGAEFVTWVLGTYAENDGVLRAELSLPLHFEGAQYTRFQTRIILLSGDEGGRIVPARSRVPDDREGPVEIVDIAVHRR